MRTIRYEIDDRHDGMQVGAFLKGKGCSRAILTLLKKNDGLHLNGEHIRTVDTVKSGDILSMTFKDVSGAFPNASLKADVVYDDEDVAVFDKPADMPVHTSVRHGRDTLENLFAALYPDCYFHVVGRLDKNTSGLVVTAKNKFAAAKMMSDRRYQPKKLYYAVTDRGIMDEYGTSGEIIAPLARDADNEIKRTVREDGEYAHTIFRVIMSNDRYCLHEIKLVTGRTHQIRVHFAHLGYPLTGDPLYGGDTSVLHRQALHCGKMTFLHPVTDREISLTSPLPGDMAALFDKNTENIVL